MVGSVVGFPELKSVREGFSLGDSGLGIAQEGGLDLGIWALRDLLEGTIDLPSPQPTSW